jgi:hypothetical protein
MISMIEIAKLVMFVRGLTSDSSVMRWYWWSWLLALSLPFIVVALMSLAWRTVLARVMKFGATVLRRDIVVPRSNVKGSSVDDLDAE